MEFSNVHFVYIIQNVRNNIFNSFSENIYLFKLNNTNNNRTDIIWKAIRDCACIVTTSCHIYGWVDVGLIINHHVFVTSVPIESVIRLEFRTLFYNKMRYVQYIADIVCIYYNIYLAKDLVVVKRAHPTNTTIYILYILYFPWYTFTYYSACVYIL